MSQITLADLKRNKDTAVQEGKEETGEKSFSLKERARIEEIKGEIDIRDVQLFVDCRFVGCRRNDYFGWKRNERTFNGH